MITEAYIENNQMVVVNFPKEFLMKYKFLDHKIIVHELYKFHE